MPATRLFTQQIQTTNAGDSQAIEGVLQVLAQSARRRIAIFAGVFAGAFGVGFLLSLVVAPLLGKADRTSAIMAILCGFLTATSLSLRALARSPRVAPASLIRVGLVYVVLGCLAMSGAEVLLGPSSGRPRDGISGICVWLVMFPLIIPAAPRQALITAITGASMLPVVYLIGRAVGNPALPWTALLDWFLPLYFCAGLAYAAARAVFSWGSALAEANRELEEMGSYQLVEPIARGGMGVVWLARHRFLSRDTAVKLIDRQGLGGSPGDLAGSRLAEFFEREARSIAQLQSPHTIEIYDYGVSAGGQLYIAMELLRGTDLEGLIDRHGPQPPGRVIHIMRQVCLSLGEAHAKGLIHRDIKPGNIFLCQRGLQYDWVKVLDFGLASLVATAQDEQRSGSIIGTPGYLAPECIVGGSIDHRSDLYALGCVAYLLLTGEAPFGVEEDDLLLQHVRRPLRPVRDLRPEVPTDLADLIAELLAKRPEQRPADAEQVIARLDACADADAWSSGEARTWWLSHGPVASAGERDSTLVLGGGPVGHGNQVN